MRGRFSTVTKIDFEHELNGLKEKYHIKEGELSSIDTFYDAWEKSGSVSKFGCWLRRNHNKEFMDRFQKKFNYYNKKETA